MSTEAIFEAIRSNDIARVRGLLAADPSLAAARNAGGMSALTAATYYGRVEITRDLLACSPALDIFEAAMTGHAARVRELLATNPSLAAQTSPDGFSALGLAAYFGRADAANALIAAGADVNTPARNPSRVQPLHSATANPNPAAALALARLLLAAGADVQAAQQGGWTPLHQAADNNHAELVALLLQHGADPAARAENGQTPLDMAIAKNADAALAALRQA